jgi:hypothetical protein
MVARLDECYHSYLKLSDLLQYTRGDTIHIIINNQIRFTTDPKLARTSFHPNDVAKVLRMLIFFLTTSVAFGRRLLFFYACIATMFVNVPSLEIK